MSFTSPLSVTLSTGATTFNLVSTEGQKKTYRSDDGLKEIVISHSEKRRNRRTIRFNRTVLAPDPFIPAQNVEVSYSAYFVLDTPVAGFSNTDIGNDIDATDGFLAWMTGGTVMSDLMAGES